MRFGTHIHVPCRMNCNSFGDALAFPAKTPSDTLTLFSYYSPPSFLPPAEDGDYWRLLNPGTHILTATAKGFSRVSKRIYLPHNMNKAGRVDFVLEKVGSLSSLSFSTSLVQISLFIILLSTDAGICFNLGLFQYIYLSGTVQKYNLIPWSL